MSGRTSTCDRHRSRRWPSGRRKALGRQLGLAAVVDGLAEEAGGFLGGVEAHGVFGGDEVEAPLGLAVELEGRGQGGFGDAGVLGGLDLVEHVDEGRAGALEELVVALL